eukprot:9484779-Pyramimonas_sp.AAC.1
MITCFEVIRSAQILVEAEALGFPMRLAWVLVDLHRQPLRLRAFGSWSRHFCAHQGILAGSNHATGLLFLLNFKALLRLNAEAQRYRPLCHPEGSS